MINFYTSPSSNRNIRCHHGLLAFLFCLLTFISAAHASTPTQPDTELQQAIKKLTARSGPPGAYKDLTELSPLSLIQTNLWQRLRNNFEFTYLEHPTIDAQINFMQQGLQSLTSNLHDASDFLFFIVDEIDRAGLPLDIALLPLVESAFDPMAKSHQSAAGLWQFIPATADDYGLIRNSSYDGRNDVVQSTHAAIRYLKQLHKSFDGDWLLALAAYNTGPGNVRHAMQRAVRNGLSPDFWNLRLAKETRDYVPRLIAVNKMITDPFYYGLNLPEMRNRKKIHTVAVGRPISFETAADLAGVSKARIQALNTGYLKGEVPLGGPYHLTVPVESSRQLLAELSVRKINLSSDPATGVLPAPARLSAASYPDTHVLAQIGDSSTTIYKPYKKYVYESHTVKRGDNLWNISRNMKTDVDTLMQWNGKSKDSPKLQPGEKMIVAYIDEEKTSDVTQKLINYRVTANDTLFTITDRFDLSISKLKKWNPALWEKNYLQAGQAIKIPIQTSSGY